jgi:hypothetical protein
MTVFHQPPACLDDDDNGRISDTEALAHGMTHRHYKGSYYRVLHDDAHDCEDPNTLVVVYQSVKGDVWVRNKHNFDALIEVPGIDHRVPRFRRLLP